MDSRGITVGFGCAVARDDGAVDCQGRPSGLAKNCTGCCCNIAGNAAVYKGDLGIRLRRIDDGIALGVMAVIDDIAVFKYVTALVQPDNA